jgi:hypothetical protein
MRFKQQWLPELHSKMVLIIFGLSVASTERGMLVCGLMIFPVLPWVRCCVEDFSHSPMFVCCLTRIKASGCVCSIVEGLVFRVDKLSRHQKHWAVVLGSGKQWQGRVFDGRANHVPLPVGALRARHLSLAAMPCEALR